ncbi:MULTISPECIES: MoaF C-terminal domain-containing protein [Arthrobacter]|uniref:MoaF C-terminal domain-containing protein n=2 Tax=Arthrobacter TaxID=1663 RepID=A0ABU9KI14_9MICC|nr:MoaF C-terminal domain-containing protein [Arthrobacter sp. YJM1]MDP5225795.1 MoaF C-terminal domain-containing protein [Arthrobacter sp. YJM1]
MTDNGVSPSGSTTLSDTSTWLPLDGLAPGFDANKAPHDTALSGREIVVLDGRGTRIAHRFTDHEVSWDYQPGAGDALAAHEGVDEYEAFLVDDGLYFVQFHHRERQEQAVSLVLDLRDGHALGIVSTILAEDGLPAGQTRVRHDVAPGSIEGILPQGTPPSPTSSMVGRRVVWDYSPEHAYEHIYLSEQWYTWQCLAGPEAGLADTDENTVWEIRPGINVFAWREKVIPCASVTIADHRNARAIRSHGVLFGLDESGLVPTHFTFGAHGRLVSLTVHPESFNFG